MNISREKLKIISERISNMRRTLSESNYHSDPDIVAMNSLGIEIPVKQNFIGAEIGVYVKELSEEELFEVFHPYTVFMAIGQSAFVEKFGNKYDEALAEYTFEKGETPIIGYPNLTKPILKPVKIKELTTEDTQKTF